MNTLISSREVLHIIQRTLDHVDHRLVRHGARVAWIILKIMQSSHSVDVQTTKRVCMLAMLHDIGAYKTEEIDMIVKFETENVWQHAIYGYLFLKYFSPLADLAPAILYHHASEDWLQDQQVHLQALAQLIFLADRLDIFIQENGCLPDDAFLQKADQRNFSSEAVAAYRSALASCPDMCQRLQDGRFAEELEECLSQTVFDAAETEGYLRMLVYAIDFRSPYTVTHTMTTERISVALATRLGLSEQEINQVRWGAVLHDLGKIGIPVEVLEFPGKLSSQAMRVMRTHVELTGEILGDELDREVFYIAVRHHEKINGGGYPLGLRGEALTLAERILAVADIVSALSGTRSYKDAFPKERILTIICEMQQGGELCPLVTATLLRDYEAIMSEVAAACAPLLQTYSSLQERYQTLLEQMTGFCEK